MQILAFAGSDRLASSNFQLLRAAARLRPDWAVGLSRLPGQLPLFRAQLDQNPLPATVIAWRHALQSADAVIISTPEYAHNLPALVKNALEWVVSSGELAAKPVLPITLTPHAPRGDKAMQSLLWTLQAMDARIVTQLPLYQTQCNWSETGDDLQACEAKELLEAALQLLQS
ncbi:MAG: NADPH-dependent FMN reductase [Bacteroidota bacterium]